MGSRFGGRWVIVVLAGCGPNVGDVDDTGEEGTSAGPTCIDGEIGCVCLPDDACRSGLECRDGLCLMPDATSTSGETEDASSATTPPTTSETATEGSESGIPEGCGDDELEPPEECDDGNNVSGDGCNADCTLGGQLVWEQVLDGPSALHDWGQRVAVDSQDNVVVAGVTFVAGSDPNAWLVKLDDDGQIEWNDIYDGEIVDSNDGYYGIAIGPADEIVVGGWGEFGDNNSTDPIVRCYSPDGELLWMHVQPGIQDEQMSDVAVDPAGDIVALATARDPSDGAWLIRLTKLTMQGDVVWNEVIDSATNQTAYAMTVDATGAIVYAGGESPPFLRKRSIDGQSDLWAWDGELGSFPMWGIAVDPLDDLFAAGGVGNGPAHHRLARHAGDTGVLDWEREWLGSHGVYAMARGVAVDADRRPVTVGAHADGTGTTSAFVRKHDATGEQVWLYEPSSFGPTDTFVGVAVDSAGHVVASGYHGDGGGYDDLWIVKLTP